MAEAMAAWGPDGVTSRCLGEALLGHARLSVAPEARHERMPWEEPVAGILVTAAARLDNRRELCRDLHIPANERATLGDGHLTAMAFVLWGEEAPGRLFGDWSFAAWNGRERRLFLARDHLGNTGLFYFHRPPFFAFASTAQAILALRRFEWKLDEWRLARYLTVFPGQEADRSRTYWEDIRLLPPAHQMSVTPHALKVRTYWRIEDAPTFRLTSDKAYSEGFLELFRRAVRVRLRSDRPVGSQLSAGLDSSSVTALAAEMLEADRRTLPSFTSVPLHPAAHLVPGALADEWSLAHTLAEKYENIQHISIRAEGVSPLAGVRAGLRICGHPLHAATNLFWIRSIHEEAQRMGIRVLLTGQMGNGGVSWSGGSHRILFLLLQGRSDEGMRALREYKKARGFSWYRAIRSHLLGPILGPLWYRCRQVVHPWQAPWSRYGAIHPEFARRMGLRETMKAENHNPLFARPRDPEWERRQTIMMNAPAGYIHHQWGAAFRMEVRDPTADVRLITFCLGIPDDQYSRDGGERMLLRRSMRGILSQELIENTVRGRQAADVPLRLLDHREEMEGELAALASHDAVGAYLDVNALRAAWRSLQAGGAAAQASQRSAFLLLRGVMAGRFVTGLTDRG
ncbi:asparagine synthase-related protein [Desulfatiglans anilini]|uniref:asparagine synthase-related protein n=1 Tax=Desulfatiglans anilini TaxID=90728 RepID=UPI000482F6DC|nr:asparagine synthase-related protein [Desulfatiglans anilini]